MTFVFINRPSVVRVRYFIYFLLAQLEICSAIKTKNKIERYRNMQKTEVEKEQVMRILGAR